MLFVYVLSALHQEVMVADFLLKINATVVGSREEMASNGTQDRDCRDGLRTRISQRMPSETP